MSVQTIKALMQSARRDLYLAKAEIEKMAETTLFSEFEVNWQTFLFRVERAWDYVESQMGCHPKGQKWISKHASMRRKDPLLRFVKQARNSEAHAVSPTVSKDVILSITERTGRPFNVESVEVSLKDGVFTWNINTHDKTIELDPKVLPGNPTLTRFENRGTWYNPPTEHLGDKITDLHPVAIAMLCVEYYRKAVDEAEKISVGL